MLATILLVVCGLLLVSERADRVQSARVRAVSETERVDDRSSPPSTRDATEAARRRASARSVSLTAPRPAGLYRRKPATYWAFMYRERTRQLQQARRALQRRWQPTVAYALTLASRVFGVPYGDLSRVAWCESTHNPFATNGRQRGLFQLGWRPFGLDPYDPVANALSAAQTVVHDGSWRQWVCKP